GAQTLNVLDTTSFPAAPASVKITVSGVTDTISYTGTTQTSFTGVTLTAGADITLATGNPVVSGSPLSTASFTGGGVTTPSTLLTATAPVGYPAAGTLHVTHAGTTDTFTYGAISGNSFTGVQYVSGAAFNLTQGDNIAAVQAAGTFTITWDSPTVLANGAAVQKAGPLLAGSTTATDLN